MAETFNFESDLFGTFEVQPQTRMSVGQNSTNSINDPKQFSVSTITPPFQAIETFNDVDMFAMAITAGQRVTFDVDFAYGSGDRVDAAIDIVDGKGILVASNDTGHRTDPGSSSGIDPFLTFMPDATGVYFVVVRQSSNQYIDGTFSYSRDGTDSGYYQMNVSIGSLPKLTELLAGDDTRTFTSSSERVEAKAGNDRLWLGGGNDIASGGRGVDRIFGGEGDDQLTGGEARDRLEGEAGDDAIIGGTGSDHIQGNDGDDVLMGGDDSDGLEGNDGNDILWGERGYDGFIGGKGNDVFVFTSVFDSPVFAQGDVIRDFAHDPGNNDKINFAGVFEGTLTFVGYLGSRPFSGTPGELGWYRGSSDTRFSLVIDIDGDKRTDMSIDVWTNHNFSFSQDDFFL